MNSGIYQIVNRINSKRYIGSSVRLLGRKKRHFSELDCNIHHSQALQRAWNKYGKENFDFLILEYCEPCNLLEREQYYIDTLLPEYNICKIAGNCLGVKHTEETKEKRGKLLKKIWKEKNLDTPHCKQNRQKKKDSNNIIRQAKELRNKQIIEDIKSGMRQDIIAEKYNLSPSVITQLKKKSNIIIETVVRKGSNNNFSKLNEQQVREIKKLLQNRVRQREIADLYNVTVRTIKAIKSGQNWSHITIEQDGM